MTQTVFIMFSSSKFLGPPSFGVDGSQNGHGVQTSREHEKKGGNETNCLICKNYIHFYF
jgi:hypothetical protein